MHDDDVKNGSVLMGMDDVAVNEMHCVHSADSCRDRIDLMMIKEWLLIATIGTTTNFTVISVHPTATSCDRERSTVIAERVTENTAVTWICTQNLSEGRSLYPARRGSGGIAGKTGG